jgi:hypothetical protein
VKPGGELREKYPKREKEKLSKKRERKKLQTGQT